VTFLLQPLVTAAALFTGAGGVVLTIVGLCGLPRRKR
jgi:hypothetical protein